MVSSMSTETTTPCPPILHYPSRPGRFTEAVLLQRMNAQDQQEHRILYITFPEDGEFWGERWWATNDGYLDKTIVTWANRYQDHDGAADACRTDWEHFVSPVLHGDGYHATKTRGVVKVP